MNRFSQIHQYTHILSVTKIDLSWLNNLFMVIFQLIRMSSYAKNKLLMCLFTQHQCRRRQIWAKLSQIHPVHSLFICYRKWLVLTKQSIHGNVSTHVVCSLMLKNKLQMCSVTQHQCRRRSNVGKFFLKFTQYTHILSVTKNYLSWLNNLFMVIFQLIRMSSYAKNKLTSCHLTMNSVDVAKCGESLFLQIHLKNTHFLSSYKNDLSWLNNLFMVRFQLISLSSYAKNKLQMCSVTQHQCRWRQMWKSF